ncbi:glycosyltransferase involved in cell wall biosynthesis [Microbacterium terrae]|uniref:Glycosyl transferase n=1 Tax=Microbacterium terrae TaxID=69369 RepID=A0A0M2H5G7_9MICO|nr:glycosyltransferase [Microbacterium terrae]KJL41735.1 putative glycosyl transferase [Microbacterium terrae]MBP1077974.1 glycosyltransferase involved in cell wall biosynthesis [Microbacterium terrae]GLK00145.1 hypothetical protein GCM10017594_33420 [Microbacterium terrae]
MIVAFGTYDKDRHPRVAIIIDGLRAHGHDVVEINHPLGLSTAERVRMLRQPWRLPALGTRMISRWRALRRDAKRLIASGADVSTVVVGYLGHFDVLLARRVFRRSTIVLDHLIFAGDTAQDRGAQGIKVRLLQGLDRRAIAAADVVVVDTPEHAAMLPASARGVVVPVGARDEWFDVAPAEGSDVGSPADAASVVFFGLYTPLQGAPVIARALATAIDGGAPLTATLVGTGQDWQEARDALGDRAGVTWIDWVEPAALPALVARHDIALGIFGASGKALRVVPNKVYESAAAGCAVITSDTPPQRALLDGAVVLIPPGDADALAAELTRFAADASALASARRAARGRAADFRADRIVEPLLAELEATS